MPPGTPSAWATNPTDGRVAEAPARARLAAAFTLIECDLRTRLEALGLNADHYEACHRVADPDPRHYKAPSLSMLVTLRPGIRPSIEQIAALRLAGLRHVSMPQGGRPVILGFTYLRERVFTEWGIHTKGDGDEQD